MLVKVIRCSSLDRVVECSGSLVDTDTPYNPTTPEANEGRASHKALVALSHGQVPDVETIAAEYGVDAHELAMVVTQAHAIWRDVAKWFPIPKPEVLMDAPLAPDVLLRGTTDMISVVASLADPSIVERIAILDWKTGWKPTDHPNQLRGYAYLAREKHGMPTKGHILGVEVWVRLGEIRIYKFSADDLDRLKSQVLEQVELRGRQYAPSTDACKYCPLQLECKAREQWMRSGVVALEPVGENKPVSRDLVAAVYSRAEELRKALDRYDALVKTYLDEGPLLLPDGRQVVWDLTEEDSINAAKAMPYLRNELRLNPDEAAEVLTLTKSGLKAVMMARAPKRQGAEYIRNAMKRLEELGAVRKITKRKKKVVAS